MRNSQNQITKEFAKFLIGMERQTGGLLSSSFLVTYESGKQLVVEICRNWKGKSIRQERWVWEITGDELTLTFKAYERGEEVLHFKRV
jgi:hypothetical protein